MSSFWLFEVHALKLNYSFVCLTTTAAELEGKNGKQISQAELLSSWEKMKFESTSKSLSPSCAFYMSQHSDEAFVSEHKKFDFRMQVIRAVYALFHKSD
jgi:hypothetical protein